MKIALIKKNQQEKKTTPPQDITIRNEDDPSIKATD